MHVVTRRDVEAVAQRLASLQEKCKATGAHRMDLAEIDTIQANLDALEERRRQLLNAIALLPPSIRHAYLRASSKLRLSSRAIGLEWYTTAVISGAVFFVDGLLLGLLLRRTFSAIGTASCMAFIFGFGLTAVCLLIPSNKQFEKAMDLDAYDQELQSRLRQLQYQAKLRREHERCQGDYTQILERFKSRLNQLLLIDWRALRGVQFETFLVEVFQAIGYAVETTRASGDQGIDLIAFKNGRRIAIQAKGYANSVGNSAVQEAFAGKAHYQCHECVVITNSEFTRGAQELAATTGCRLVSRDQIPALINGKLF